MVETAEQGHRAVVKRQIIRTNQMPVRLISKPVGAGSDEVNFPRCILIQLFCTFQTQPASVCTCQLSKEHKYIYITLRCVAARQMLTAFRNHNHSSAFERCVAVRQAVCSNVRARHELLCDVSSGHIRNET